MNESFRHRAIPLLCFLLGLGAAVLMVSFVGLHGAGADAEVQARFEQLPQAEQELILNKAAAYEKRWQSDPEERERLQRIHQATQADPALQEKLGRLHKWWLTLESGQKDRLKTANGEFVDNWLQEAGDLFLETQNAPHEIAVKFVNVKFTEQALQQFLDEVIPSTAPSELQQRLEGLANADQECERTLARLIWLNDHLGRHFQRNGADRSTPGEPSLIAVRSAVEEYLVDSATRERFRRYREKYFRELRADDPRFYFMVLPFVRAAIDHYDNRFKEKHLGNPKTSLVELFDSLDRETQLQLLRRDAAEAQKALERTLIQQKYAENPALAGLADDLRRVHTRPPFRGGFSRGGSSRGRGERTDFGGPPREERGNGNRPLPDGFRAAPPERGDSPDERLRPPRNGGPQNQR
ncbi:MAG: hypothetical protein RIK87_26430 [Fuerstiella sp.]